MVLERDILATANRDMCKGIPSKNKHSRSQCCPTNCCVVQFQADQSRAEGVYDIEEDLVKSIIAGLTRTDTRVIVGNRCSGEGRLEQAP